MKYDQDRNASGELLRLLIQKMSSHPAAFTPYCYAVWYEHLAGINPKLNEAMAQLTAEAGKLDDETVDRLYTKYVSECNLDVGRTLRVDIQQLLGNLAGATQETEQHAQQFGTNLQVFGDSLKQTVDAPKLITLVKAMSAETAAMRNSMQTLQSELVSSKKQVEGLQHALESARGEAMNDPLTGILNRRGFEARAQQIIAANNGKELHLLMLDIDHFKKINDRYGHLFGDKVIHGIADILRSKVRGQDCVARLGGEEFAVLLTETDLSGALVVAETIRSGIESCKIHKINSGEKIGGITISIGVAPLNSSGTLVEAIDRADQALYVSKGEGRNRTTVHSTMAAGNA